MQVAEDKRSSWLDQPLLSAISPNWETLIFAVILILAVLSRFYDLETRVMSHDETSHVYFSWQLYKGQGFQHSPLLHGPLQFHLIALSYFLFGDNDFTARIPSVLASIATIAFLWNYRRYLGRAGALVAAALFLISPFMLYYGRYVRNEAFVALFGVVTLWAILRYLDTGTPRYLYFLSAAMVLHFAAKETAFIYTAQALIFLGFLFLYQVFQDKWLDAGSRRRFALFLILALLFLIFAVSTELLSLDFGTISPEETAAPHVPGEDLEGEMLTPSSPLTIAFALVGGLAFLVSFVFLIRGYGLEKLRQQRAFGLMLLLFTLVLPQMAPFPMRAMGWNPIDYGSPDNLWQTAVFLVPLALVAAGMGLLWNRRVWLISNAIFYAIFVVLFTTVFTNGGGFFTGIVGSLGYWLEQQGVQRGNQPPYYYLLVQVPVYEYLAAFGSLLAAGLGVAHWFNRRDRAETELAEERGGAAGPLSGDPAYSRRIAILLIAFWVVTSFIAYSLAGEKMPWLTVHIALPMLLLAGWAVGQLIEATDWAVFHAQCGWLVIALLPVFFTALLSAFGSLLGPSPPFQGAELEQLRATSTFLMALITSVLSGWGLFYLLRDWTSIQTFRVGVLTIFALLGLLTARTAILAAYVNYNDATEYLVYAHTAGGPKEVLKQVEEISRRTTNGLALRVAYDDETSYPYWWYLRNYSNQRFYGAEPTRELRDFPVIIVGEKNYGKIEPIVGQAFYQFDYIRMWWPNQDYFNLTPDRLRNLFTDAELRAALFQIWLNRDYSSYEQLTGRDFSLPNWSPASRMRMYLRKDVAAELWDYGVAPVGEVIADPYEGKEVQLTPDLELGLEADLSFNAPRDLAVALDGSVYIADSLNHRIVHLDAEGALINAWGGFAAVDQGDAPGGFFNEPWGLDIGPDGSVYVADTWNHRIQKFTADGEFLSMWGFFDQSDEPNAFWGPRDVAVDGAGNVFVTDTGNKRIALYDQNAEFIAYFGGVGFSPGEFDEPVGITVSAEGIVYVADTWNQRIQAFEAGDLNALVPLTMWDINAWYGQSLDNKPYLSTDPEGRLYIADPEGGRILVFESDGEFIQYWTGFGSGFASSVAFDGQAGVWATDSANNRLLHFALP